MKAFYFFFLLLSASAVLAQKPGTTDKTFARNGRRADTVGRYADYPALTVQPDDKILIGGRGFLKPGDTKTFRVDRLQKDGTPDRSFGSSGSVVIDLHAVRNADDYIADLTALAVQADGKILACGNFVKGNYDYVVVRLLANGTIDSSFGTNGIALPNTNDKRAPILVNTMAVQKDGRILVGGSVNERFMLTRLLPNGRIDSSFSGDGQIVAANGLVNAIALQPDGKILAGGANGASNARTRFLIRRYKTNGTLDQTFGNGGTVDTAISSLSYVSDLALQADGRIVAGANSADQYGFYPYFTVARLNKNGSMDNSFGTKGVVIPNLSGQPYGREAYCRKVLLSGDRIVLAGYEYINAPNNSTDLIMIACRSTGSTDSSFGVNGVLTANFDYADYISSAAMQSDGKFILSGISRDNDQTYEVRNVLRYYGYTTQSSAGSADRGFSSVQAVASAVRLYPNPANDYVVISGLQAGVAATVVIRDGLGKTMAVYTTGNASQYRCNISTLAPGIYYAEIKAAGKTIGLKFVKQ